MTPEEIDAFKAPTLAKYEEKAAPTTRPLASGTTCVIVPSDTRTVPRSRHLGRPQRPYTPARFGVFRM
jgi:hypothetical protein